jgi:hypothetical protein
LRPFANRVPGVGTVRHTLATPLLELTEGDANTVDVKHKINDSEIKKFVCVRNLLERVGKCLDITELYVVRGNIALAGEAVKTM